MTAAGLPYNPKKDESRNKFHTTQLVKGPTTSEWDVSSGMGSLIDDIDVAKLF